MRSPLRSLLALVTLYSSLSMFGCGSDGTVLPPPSSFSPSVISQWNQEVLRAVTLSSPRPTVVARSLFLIHSAVYDAWAAHDDVALGSVTGGNLRRPVEERTLSRMQEACAYAAFHTAVALFPSYETNTQGFSSLLRLQGYSTDPAVLANNDPSQPSGLGHLVADQVLLSRANDGSNAANNFADTTSAIYPALYQPVNSPDPLSPQAVGGAGFDAARWTPLRVPNGTLLDGLGFPLVNSADPSTFSDQQFLTPHWGAVTTFAVSHGAALRPPAPPQPGSNAPYVDGLGVLTSNDAAYNQQIDEVVQINRDLNDTQKCIAEYWADGPTSDTPPGHWNEFAQDLSFRYQFGLEQDAVLFFALNGGLLDSSICCWESKRFYDFIRPVSAIQHRFFNQNIQGWAGPGQGTQTLLGQQWRPFQRLTFITPGFAEYTSGHSTFSGCAAQILTRFTGSNRLFDPSVVLPWDRNGDGAGDILGEFRVRPGSLTIEPGLPAQEVVLRWNTLQEAADEAGVSRRFGGIHFQDGDLRARTMGLAIGELAFQRAIALSQGIPQP